MYILEPILKANYFIMYLKGHFISRELCINCRDLGKSSTHGILTGGKNSKCEILPPITKQ